MAYVDIETEDGILLAGTFEAGDFGLHLVLRHILLLLLLRLLLRLW